jgi:hypothetical protein
MIKKLISKFKKEKVVDPTENSSGDITISYDSKTGDFYVVTDIKDISDDSATILAYILHHVSNGEISQFIYEALSLWAEEEEERQKFNHSLFEKIVVVSGMLKEEEEKNKSKKEKVAVRASEVFNLNTDM